MKKLKLLSFSFLTMVLVTTSCVNDLDVTPIDPNVVTSEELFKDPAAHKQALAKIYASYATGGQTGGGGGNSDIQGIDENFGNYTRILFNMEELPTDEAIMAWDDATVKSFHTHTWASNDVFLAAFFSRIYYTITLSNGYVRVANTAIASASGTQLAEMKTYLAEARFLRAYSYYQAIDNFGNVPFVTEADEPGTFSPARITRADLFKWLETELKDIEPSLMESKTNEYGRVDKAAAQMLLAKIYLNAKVYTGIDRSADARLWIEKVIASPYSIDPFYNRLFCADNSDSPEIIFPICLDGQNTQNYGGTTFIEHACSGGGMDYVKDLGIEGGWGGIMTLSTFVSKFNVKPTDFTINTATKSVVQNQTNSDRRGIFFWSPSAVKDTSRNADGSVKLSSSGKPILFTKIPKWEWNTGAIISFTNGIGVTKFKNLTHDGKSAPNAHPTFSSTDFPVFRLADAYLIYAEAVVRGGGGDITLATSYINVLRARGQVAAWTTSDLTLDNILDERGRELYFEAQRRTDLIRFEKLTQGTYLWDWKGGVATGIATDPIRNLYPIPANAIMANPNLIQNPGYN